ncbi:26S proteasome non-ATPase regulatory subunit 11A-like isoform X2 [Zophobas morio]
MRTMVGSYLDMEGITVAIAIDLCKDCVEWCQKEKRSFLRQSVECRLIALYLENKSYTEALGLINKITKELKKLDDKALLAEVHLLESKAYHSLSNLTKSRSALTSARTAANAIYCPPRLQGALDLQSGILNAEEKDFKTAYSYFYETFECYDSSGEAELATTPLKYMLLSKIMLNLPEDVESIINNKICSKYAGKHMEAMKAVASSLRDRSLDKFKSVLAEYPNELSEDPIIVSHLTDLYETMFEQNLFRIIEPFSRVEIAHISALINIPVTVVEEKLSKMILDQKFAGVLDQRAGCLIVYDSKVVDESYSVALQSIIHMNKVVDSLYAKAQQLTHWN